MGRELMVRYKLAELTPTDHDTVVLWGSPIQYRVQMVHTRFIKCLGFDTGDGFSAELTINRRGLYEDCKEGWSWVRYHRLIFFWPDGHDLPV